MRKGACERVTSETALDVRVDVDGDGETSIAIGLPMFDHLLAQLAFHSGFGIRVAGRSLDGIAHHLIEDAGIALGRAFAEALGDRAGIRRYGSALIPMDDALVRVALDLGGRFFIRYDVPVAAQQVEGLEVAMVAHFFRSFACNASITLHADLLAGEDPHHCIEAAFKAIARALREAAAPTGASQALTTKGLF